MEEKMKILILAASAQRQSVNKRLAQSIELLLRARGFADIERPDFKSFTMPMYDGDLEMESGVPAAARDLADHVQKADAVIICTPEYNGSIPGSLKNALDWVSRISPHPLIGKPVLMTGASPGVLGSIRSLWHSRVPFEALGAFVFPEMFGLGLATDAFDADGQLKDPKRQQQLAQLCEKFLAFAART
ncbi:MAG: NADPH-dependent FMN reductase [Baekduiaceae bacterium]